MDNVGFRRKDAQQPLGYKTIYVSDEEPLPVRTATADDRYPLPVTGYGGGEMPEPGPDSPWALGREILEVEEREVDLATIPDIEKYSYVDVRSSNVPAGTDVNIKLPLAEDFGPGRILYILDKVGRVDGEGHRSQIYIRPQPGDGIDGKNFYVINERNGFVGLRATQHRTSQQREWQVVAVNSPIHHTGGGFYNITTFTELNKGHVSRLSGAHVYTPVKFEVYDEHAARGRFLIRFYPTDAMAQADKDRPFGDPVPEGIAVYNEMVIGGAGKPNIGYSPGQVVSSWDVQNKPMNVYVIVYQQLDGAVGRLSGSVVAKDMVLAQ